MADKKISELGNASSLTGEEQVPLVQSDTTKKTTINDIKNYMKAVHITAQAGVNIQLSDAAYADANVIKYSWTGSSGTAVHTLPGAAASENRVIRFISDSTFSPSNHVDITPASGETLDGSSNNYRINKDYEGIQVWSDGIEWFIIQKKA